MPASKPRALNPVRAWARGVAIKAAGRHDARRLASGSLYSLRSPRPAPALCLRAGRLGYSVSGSLSSAAVRHPGCAPDRLRPDQAGMGDRRPSGWLATISGSGGGLAGHALFAGHGRCSALNFVTNRAPNLRVRIDHYSARPAQMHARRDLLPCPASSQTAPSMASTPQVRHYTVDDESAGQRLDNFLLRGTQEFPRPMSIASSRSGEVRINKGPRRPTPDCRGDLVPADPPVRENRGKAGEHPPRRAFPVLFGMRLSWINKAGWHRRGGCMVAAAFPLASSSNCDAPVFCRCWNWYTASIGNQRHSAGSQKRAPGLAGPVPGT